MHRRADRELQDEMQDEMRKPILFVFGGVEQ